MPSNRVFRYSLALSGLLHLSMITVFSIVIVFPREDVQYHSFSIVASGNRGVVSLRDQLRTQSPDQLRTQSSDAAFEATRETPGEQWDAPANMGTQPLVELPTLEFAGLARLRLREEGLALRARHTEWLRPVPSDSWARFGRELGDLRDALWRWTARLGTGPREPRPQLLSRPAPGFEAYIEWLSEPRDRRPTILKPVQALWGVEPESLAQGPITLVVTVDAAGSVVEVLNPSDAAGLISAVAKALTRYRFEPLLDVDGPNQRATVLITPARLPQ